MPCTGQRDRQLQQSYPLDHAQWLLQDDATYDARDLSPLCKLRSRQVARMRDRLSRWYMGGDKIEVRDKDLKGSLLHSLNTVYVSYMFHITNLNCCLAARLPQRSRRLGDCAERPCRAARKAGAKRCHSLKERRLGSLKASSNLRPRDVKESSSCFKRPSCKHTTELAS